MEHKEAIEIVKKNYPHVGFSGSQFETALRVLVPELAESEDERIRKEMIEYFHGCIQRNKKSGFHVEQIKGWIAYLEKQKELPFVKDVILGFPGLYFYDGERMHFKGSPAMEEKQKEQKPAEWSEEDITNGWRGVDSERYLSCLQRLGTGNPQQPETINSKWFKEHCHPRPHWKPSKEQMEALKHCVDGWPDRADGILDSLYNDLKTL